MPRRVPVVLLVAAVALAGAGTAVVARRSVTGDGPPSDPRGAVVAALATRPGDVADSARYVVRYFVENPGIARMIATYEGEADFRRQRFLARGRFFREDGSPRAFDSFVLSEWEYTRTSGETRWERGFFDPSEAGSPTPELTVVGGRGENLAAPSYAGDADTRRRIVDALVAEVVEAGREEHHGAAVWHYRVTVDGDRAAGLLPEALRSEMRSWSEGKGRRELDLWLDGRDRLRKLSILYADEEGLGFRVENEFWDFGGPGRLDLPDDLDDPTALGGEGVTSFTIEPGVDLDQDSPGFVVRIFDRDRPGEDVTVNVSDRPAPGAESRRWHLRMTPAAGRHLEPGEYRLVDRAELNRGVPLAFDIGGPDIEARCPPSTPRTGTLTLTEAVMYEESFYVRLHLRFHVACRPSPGAPPASFTGEARYHALG